MLKDFCLIKVSGDFVALDNDPFGHLSSKLLKPSNQLCRFFERNSSRMMAANKEFLMKNYEGFRKLYKEFKKSFSQLVGNGLN